MISGEQTIGNCRVTWNKESGFAVIGEAEARKRLSAGLHDNLGGSALIAAAAPVLFGFWPANSLVVTGLRADGRQSVTLRYDLPDPADPAGAAAAANHAVSVLTSNRLPAAVAVGYGSGRMAGIAEAFRERLPAAGLRLGGILSVDDGHCRCLCGDPACDWTAPLPAPVGSQVLADREALAATLDSATGPVAAAVANAVRAAERRAGPLARSRPQQLVETGHDAVDEAIAAYTSGGQLTNPDTVAQLAVTLKALPVRDYAWARMEPARAAAHQKLWTDLTRLAPPGYRAAPASLLAFTAWQQGDGALANVALDRALAAQPDYSMAQLLRQVINAGAPPSLARLPMTPEEVTASYGMPSRQPGRARRPGTRSALPRSAPRDAPPELDGP